MPVRGIARSGHVDLARTRDRAGDFGGQLFGLLQQGGGHRVHGIRPVALVEPGRSGQRAGTAGRSGEASLRRRDPHQVRRVCLNRATARYPRFGMHFNTWRPRRPARHRQSSRPQGVLPGYHHRAAPAGTTARVARDLWIDSRELCGHPMGAMLVYWANPTAHAPHGAQPMTTVPRARLATDA